MLIHGTPLAVTLPGDSAAEPRFWYWHGASGRRYIHSVYPAESCPPLPGAVFVAVKRMGPIRTVLAIGRFSPFWDLGVADAACAHWHELGANEVHVHLLSRDERDARAVAADLFAALDDRQAAPSGQASLAA